jgi:hypothetical protein
LLPADKSFLEHVFGVSHAPQHSISDREKEAAILVESREASGVSSGLGICFFWSAVRVFAFHGLPDLMRMSDEQGLDRTPISKTGREGVL